MNSMSLSTFLMVAVHLSHRHTCDRVKPGDVAEARQELPYIHLRVGCISKVAIFYEHSPLLPLTLSNIGFNEAWH